VIHDGVSPADETLLQEPASDCFALNYAIWMRHVSQDRELEFEAGRVPRAAAPLDSEGLLSFLQYGDFSIVLKTQIFEGRVKSLGEKKATTSSSVIQQMQPVSFYQRLKRKTAVQDYFLQCGDNINKTDSSYVL